MVTLSHDDWVNAWLYFGYFMCVVIANIIGYIVMCDCCCGKTQQTDGSHLEPLLPNSSRGGVDSVSSRGSSGFVV